MKFSVNTKLRKRNKYFTTGNQ